MSLNALVAPLQRVPLFAGLEPHHLMALVRSAERQVFQPGDVIITKGQEADSAFLIVGGVAERQSDDSSAPEAEVLQVCTFLGEMAMLTETDYSSTVIAKTVVRAMRFPRAAIHELISGDPDIAEHFVAQITGRLLGVAAELRRIDAELAPYATPAGTASMH
jgi:CRP-like cAMP-binding protein